LGIGVGWMKEEFLVTGQNFHNRGRRTDEMLEVLAALFAGGPVEHHGEFYSFDTLNMEPVPSARVRVLVGGESENAFARAARNDGWFGGGPYQPEKVSELLKRLAQHRARAEPTGDDYRVMLGLASPPDVDTFRRLADEGVTDFVSLPWYYSIGPDVDLQTKLDSMARFAEEFIVPLQ
jgi:alkanesulfonate monooxygenase SsuD/methylene tetrahydromethanopterin reductase-like flavin-dependent oxidoreductase (luciferase family)